ncbi:hypothetical protein HPB48_015194 [Haemaphysalis longicornis]|uniref:Uncharacterized protein n=1 Tax=Haemaphysalis longicornis TaxID=44386 RepID=A0A9J6FIU4_HAELO|nr:hypothetical protein HPB48_015194 [Haemaphysalis longicornis]
MDGEGVERIVEKATHVRRTTKRTAWVAVRGHLQMMQTKLFYLRLQEHANSLKANVGGHLSAHRGQCRSQPEFEQCHIIRRYADKRTREINEAF